MKEGKSNGKLSYSVFLNFKILSQTFSRKDILSCKRRATKEGNLFQVTA
jgi:hypothetical protein